MKMLSRARAKATVNQSIQRPVELGAALTPAAVRRGLRFSIVEGSLSNIHVTVCAGAFLTGFALMLGAGDFELGLIAALPFLMILGPARLPIFLLILAISQALLGITANAWTSWMSDLVPPRQHGRYFGTRNTICSITA